MTKFLNVNFHYQKARQFYFKYERILIPATLESGFLADYFTFSNIQIGITFFMLAVYWLLAGTVILAINFYDAGRIPQKFKYIRLFLPLPLQFFFGALLGASLIFYWFSGAFSVSWPIMLIVAFLMIFNDVFRHYFERPALHIGVYFFATFSLFSLILPFVFSSIDVWVFLLAGVASLIVFGGFIGILMYFCSEIKRQKWLLFFVVFGIFTSMNTLYFLNIIPPIPLALREARMYREIKVSSLQYTMKEESESLWDKYFFDLIYGQKLHPKKNEKVYLYNAIFAPAKLTSKIIHQWQYYDENQKKWLDINELSFNIVGGRKEGYKGYSFMSNLQEGRWRINVQNERGQVLGRVRFVIEGFVVPIVLEEVVR